MTRLLVIPMFVLAVALASPAGPAQEKKLEPVRPGGGAGANAQEEKKAPDEAGARLEALQKKLRELQREQRRLQQAIERLRGASGEEPPAPRRPDRLQPFSRPLPTPFPFDDRFRGLEDQLKQLEEHFRQSFPNLQAMPGAGSMASGTSVSIRQTDQGVRVEVKKQDANGKESVEVYEAESPEAFAKKYPEVARNYGLSFGGDGTFTFNVLPRIGTRGDARSLRRAFPDLDPGTLLGRMMPEARDRLGVLVETLDAGRAEELGLDIEQGLVVREVQPDTLAERLGLDRGDVLLTINGKAIRDVPDVQRVLRRAHDNDTVTVEVFRPGKGKVKLDARKTPGLRKIL
jgi:hypothetical protein